MATNKLFKLFKNSFQTISASFLRTKAVDYFGAWKDVGTSISGYYLEQILALVTCSTYFQWPVALRCV